MARTLIDRIYDEMRGAERIWSAQEICRSFLHMDSTGDLAGGLVRSILGRDSRFSEPAANEWSTLAVAESVTTLWSQPLRLYWIESVGDAVSDWKLHTRLWTGDIPASMETWELAKPDSWLRGRRGEDEIPWVGWQPNLMRRALVWADRNWACTESELDPVDLTRWCAVAWLEENVGQKPSAEDLQLPRLAQRWNLGPLEESPSGCLALFESMLERIREFCPQATRESFAAAYAEALEPRTVDWERLGFTSTFWEQLPEGPGVYRFWSETDELLYVGKSTDLPRRVRSYFQNLPTTATRREDLIYQIDRIECESAPTELEALVRESQAIREESPRFNVQIEIHPPSRFPRSWKWPLVYVPKSQNTDMVTIVGLSGQDRGGLIRVEGAKLSTGSGRLLQWCHDLLAEASQSPAPGVASGNRDRSAPTALSSDVHPVCRRVSEPSLSFAPAESWLALRYYSRRHDEVSRVDPLAIHDPESLFELLVSLIADDGDKVVRLVTQ